jgi:hypothetical protein
MEDKFEQKEENVETNNVDTENTDTQTVEENEGAFKVFKTKKEYDDAFNKMKASILPPKEEMEQFKTWKENQKTQEEKYNDLVKKDTEKDTEISNLKKENEVLKAGVNDLDEVEFIVYKVSKMEGDFTDNLKQYLIDNPKYTKKQEQKATDTEKKANTVAQEDGVTAILKAKHPDIFDD